MKLNFQTKVVLWCILALLSAGLTQIVININKTPPAVINDAPNVKEQLKAIQKQIGCVDIDGKWGTETRDKYKLALERLKRAKHNEYAAAYFQETAK